MGQAGKKKGKAKSIFRSYKLEAHSWKALLPAALVIAAGLGVALTRSVLHSNKAPEIEAVPLNEEAGALETDTLSAARLESVEQSAAKDAAEEKKEVPSALSTAAPALLGEAEVRAIYQAPDEVAMDVALEKSFPEAASPAQKAQERGALENLIKNSSGRTQAWKASLKIGEKSVGFVYLQIFDARLEKQDSADALPSDDLCWKIVGKMEDGAKLNNASACIGTLRLRQGHFYVRADLEMQEEKKPGLPRLLLGLPDSSGASRWIAYSTQEERWLENELAWTPLSTAQFEAELRSAN